MPVCSVSTCRNSSTSIKDTDIILHSFPRNDKKALEWFMKCRRRDKKRPNSVDRICSIHFQAESYERDLGCELLGKPPNRKLKETATPTLNLPFIFIKPSEARKVLTPTLARNLNKRVNQSVGNAKAQVRRVSKEIDGGKASSSGINPSSEAVSRPEDQIIILKSETHCQKLLSDVFNDETYMDTTLVVQDKRIHAHKVILRQASGYFKTNLKDDPSTSNNPDRNELKFDDISYEDLSKLIAFIYHGEVSIKSSDVDRFFQASEFLEISDLKKPDQEPKSETTKEFNEKRNIKIGKKIKFSYVSNQHKKQKGKYVLTSKNNTKINAPFQSKKVIKIVYTELREGMLRFLFLLY